MDKLALVDMSCCQDGGGLYDPLVDLILCSYELSILQPTFSWIIVSETNVFIYRLWNYHLNCDSEVSIAIAVQISIPAKSDKCHIYLRSFTTFTYMQKLSTSRNRKRYDKFINPIDVEHLAAW